MVWRRAAHTAYDTAYHLVWSRKYRKGLLTGELAKRVEELFQQIAEANDITVEEMEVSVDHVHIFCSFPPALFDITSGGTTKEHECACGV